MNSKATDLLFCTLEIADNALIMGHRLSEWCGHGPILEQDIALTNIALDHLGQARPLYQKAAELVNQMSKEEKEAAFKSPMLSRLFEKSKHITEDDLAFLRDSWDFRNVLLVEQDNGDWAQTVVRSFLFDTYNKLFFAQLIHTSEPTWRGVAEKALKEVTYHSRWSSEWMIRLGDGTEESHERIQNAFQNLWPYSGELLMASPSQKIHSDIYPSVDAKAYRQEINRILETATLTLSEEDSWMQAGGKIGNHSEHLGYILAEMQYMQRAYPEMEW